MAQATLTTNVMFLPKGYELKGLAKYDGRICFALYYFTDLDDLAEERNR